MRNIRLLIEYEGTAYVGWQRQVQPNSIQQVLEEAVERVAGEKVCLVGASRTDAGVHALGQVAHFHTSTRLSAERLRDALNAVLPRDIAVVRAEDAPESFHARFDATNKRYDYLIVTGPVRPVFERRYAWHVTYPLDLDRMRAAAAPLLGTHDFAGFASSGHQHGDTVRTVTRCDLIVGRADDQAPLPWGRGDLWRRTEETRRRRAIPQCRMANGELESAGDGDQTRRPIEERRRPPESQASPLPMAHRSPSSGEPPSVVHRPSSPQSPSPFILRPPSVPAGDRLLLVMEGNGFLYNMVRAVAGTLVDIGRGRLPVERVAEVLETRDRRRAGVTAPARGLCLVRVDYPAEATA